MEGEIFTYLAWGRIILQKSFIWRDAYGFIKEKPHTIIIKKPCHLSKVIKSNF